MKIRLREAFMMASFAAHFPPKLWATFWIGVDGLRCSKKMSHSKGVRILFVKRLSFGKSIDEELDDFITETIREMLQMSIPIRNGKLNCRIGMMLKSERALYTDVPQLRRLRGALLLKHCHSWQSFVSCQMVIKSFR